jgi:2-phospho-L-lactate/phosphoenolpyruvate guanylyltransferase
VPTIVIPFAGAGGKTRLAAPTRIRRELSLGMLADVLAAASAAGSVRVVTGDAGGAALAREVGAVTVRDPGGGQGPAVAAALAEPADGAILIVNADLPCARPDDLRALAVATPARGLALVEAPDGTTNALGLSAASVFAPLYGPGSAARFRAHAAALGLEATTVQLESLVEDVDTLDDLRRLRGRLGPRSRAALAEPLLEVAG